MNYEQIIQYEQEFNDTTETATTIQTNGSNHYGAIKDSVDVDFYTFSLPKPGKIELNVVQKQGSEWYVYVYDKNEEVVSYAKINRGNKTEKLVLGLSSGQYFVKFVDTSYSDVFFLTVLQLSKEYIGAIQQKMAVMMIIIDLH